MAANRHQQHGDVGRIDPRQAAGLTDGVRTHARQHLARLPEGQRQAIEMLKLKEMSLKEASAASGQSVGALKVAVHRGIKALRALMGDGR